jgi:hypothetical protein
MDNTRATGRITGVLNFFPSSVILENGKHDVSETDPVSETSCFYSLEYPTMEKVQKTHIFYVLYTIVRTL